jgi:hypothetical protein
LGFAVRRPAQRQASPRGHRMPCGDVPGRVDVCVAGEIAGRTGKGRLALAVLCRYVPTCRAALARECRVDLLDTAGGFLLQPLNQHPPARCQDFPVQPRLGAHVPTRLDHGAFGGAGHVLYSQVLDPDRGEAPRQIRGQLLGPVLPGISFAGFQPGDRGPYVSAALTATPSPHELSLKRLEPALPPIGQARTNECLTGRKRGADCDAPIHAYDVSSPWPVDRCRNCRERDVPAAGPIQLHPERPGLRDRSRPAEPQPPGLRDEDLSPVPVQSADLARPKCNDPEPFIPASFAPGRSTVRTGEVVRHGLSEIPQRLLLDRHTARCQPYVLGARLGQLAALLGPAWHALAPGPPPGLLLDSEIPYKPGVSTMVPQHLLLCRRRHQPVARHGNMISKTIHYCGEGRAITPPALRPGSWRKLW